MNTPPVIRILLDSPTAQYQPGDRLSGRFLVEGTQMRTIRSAELSVLWYTAGKGEEDFAVHHFERHVDDVARPLDLRVPRKFATESARQAHSATMAKSSKSVGVSAYGSSCHRFTIQSPKFRFAWAMFPPAQKLPPTSPDDQA